MAMMFRGAKATNPYASADMAYAQPADTQGFVPVVQPAPREASGKPNWAGVGADFLAGLAGQQPVFAPMQARQNQHRQDMEDAAAQRQAQVQDWIFKQQYEAANPGPSPLSRDVAAFQNLTPEQRKAYGEMQDLKAGPTTVSLPNGFIYSGNRAGLGEALGGAAQPLTQAPADVPAPTMGANGNPQFLTLEQYLAVEQKMGPEKTQAWAQRNRIPIAKTVNGVTAYQIGGKWYDNPEGR